MVVQLKPPAPHPSCTSNQSLENSKSTAETVIMMMIFLVDHHLLEAAYVRFTTISKNNDQAGTLNGYKSPWICPSIQIGVGSMASANGMDAITPARPEATCW